MSHNLPIEYRRASVSDVNQRERIIELVAVPYEEEAVVEYRGEMWRESFLRGSFDGIEERQNPIRANRDHDRQRTVGKLVKFDTSDPVGLITNVFIAPTDLGEETLILAENDMLSASVGFGVRGSDQILDRPFRKIKRAFMDHLAFVESPAYVGAKVLAVRDDEEAIDASKLPPLNTPHLDEVVAWMQSRR